MFSPKTKKAQLLVLLVYFLKVLHHFIIHYLFQNMILKFKKLKNFRNLKKQGFAHALFLVQTLFCPFSQLECKKVVHQTHPTKEQEKQPL